MNLEVWPDSMCLTLHDTQGCVIGCWYWWDKQPFLVVVMGEGRLRREEVEALRDYCDAVLARMEPAP
jgi:hypothetical protein